MKTKLQLQQELDALSTQNFALRKEIGELRMQLIMRATPSYPLTDKLGRRYRLDGAVRCFQPHQ